MSTLTVGEKELDILLVDKADLKDKVAFITTSRECTHEFAQHLRDMFASFGKKYDMADAVVIPNATVRFLNPNVDITQVPPEFIDELKKL